MGLALTLYAEVGVVGHDDIPERGQIIDEHHPATLAFHGFGGRGTLWLRCPIPMGRGLGFSAAVRVGGLLAAHAQRVGDDSAVLDSVRPEVLRLAADLEGHGDNAAAAVYGGFTVFADGRAIRVPVALDATVVCWVPATITRTDRSRAQLPEMISFADAAHNIERTALLVAAFAGGDVSALAARPPTACTSSAASVSCQGQRRRSRPV